MVVLAHEGADATAPFLPDVVNIRLALSVKYVD